MRKILCGVLLVNLLFLAACNKKDSFTDPVISVTPMEAEGWRLDTLIFEVEMSGAQQLDYLEISPDFDQSQSAVIAELNGLNSATYTYAYRIAGTLSDSDIVNIDFTVFDVEFLEKTVTAKITVRDTAQ